MKKKHLWSFWSWCHAGNFRLLFGAIAAVRATTASALQQPPLAARARQNAVLPPPLHAWRASLCGALAPAAAAALRGAASAAAFARIRKRRCLDTRTQFYSTLLSCPSVTAAFAQGNALVLHFVVLKSCQGSRPSLASRTT